MHTLKLLLLLVLLNLLRDTCPGSRGLGGADSHHQLQEPIIVLSLGQVGPLMPLLEITGFIVAYVHVSYTNSKDKQLNLFMNHNHRSTDFLLGSILRSVLSGSSQASLPCLQLLRVLRYL